MKLSESTDFLLGMGMARGLVRLVGPDAHDAVIDTVRRELAEPVRAWHRSATRHQRLAGLGTNLTRQAALDLQPAVRADLSPICSRCLCCESAVFVRPPPLSAPLQRQLRSTTASAMLMFRPTEGQLEGLHK